MAVISYFLAFVLVALLVYVLRYSGRLRFTLVESFPVNAQALAKPLADLETWKYWNPWQDHDPAVSAVIGVDAAGKVNSFSWQSAKTAKIRVINAGPLSNGRLIQRFEGSAPFSFKGRLTWLVEPDGDHAKLRLSFKGRVGFAQRAFSKTVQKMLALDFSYALNKLGIFVANSAGVGYPEGYSIEYLGLVNVEPRTLVVREYEGLSKNIGMTLLPLIRELHADTCSGAPLAQAEVHYLQTNLKTGVTKCKYGFDLGQPENNAAQYACASCLATVTRLRGNLAGLEAAWYLAMQQIRASGDQPDQRFPPFERYIYVSDDPAGEVAYVDLYFPIKKIT